MKTRRHRLVRSHRQRPRSHRKIRSNCKKTRQRRTFRRAQHVGGGRKSRYRSKKLKGGARHFDPNVKPTKDKMGFKKDIETVNSEFLYETKTNQNYFSDKVYEFLEKKKKERNIHLQQVNVEAYMPKELTEKAKKFIRVKITPVKNDYQYELTKNRVKALLENLTIEDFENAADIQLPAIEKKKQVTLLHTYLLDFPVTNRRHAEIDDETFKNLLKQQVFNISNKKFLKLPSNIIITPIFKNEDTPTVKIRLEITQGVQYLDEFNELIEIIRHALPHIDIQSAVVVDSPKTAQAQNKLTLPGASQTESNEEWSSESYLDSPVVTLPPEDPYDTPNPGETIYGNIGSVYGNAISQKQNETGQMYAKVLPSNARFPGRLSKPHLNYF